MRLFSPGLLALALAACATPSTEDSAPADSGGGGDSADTGGDSGDSGDSGVANTAPVVTLTAPTGEDPYYAGTAIAVEAVVADAEDGPGALTVAWTDEAGATLAIDDSVDQAGLLSGTTTLTQGEHTLTVTVTDSGGLSASASVQLTVGGENTAPSCELLQPIDGGSGPADEAVTLEGRITDPDVDAHSLNAQWKSDLDGVLMSETVGSGGITEVAVRLSVGTHVLTLRGKDDVGATCTATATYTVANGPEVTILTPTDGQVFNEGEAVPFTATAIDDVTAPEELMVEWKDSVAGPLDTTAPDPSGFLAFDATGLAVGDHTMTLKVTDGDGSKTKATVDYTINGLPSAPGLNLRPATPYDDDDLTVTVTGPSVDPERDRVTYAYVWTVNGVLTADTGTGIAAADTTRGDVWAVSVTPNDGYGDGPAGTASVTIANHLPEVASATLTPDPASAADTLVCTAGTTSDGDGDTVTTSVSWTVSGAVVPVTTDTLDGSWFGNGDSVSCTVTPNDGWDDGVGVTSNAVSITNTAPSLVGAAISPSTAYAGDTLTCATVAFADADGDADQSTFAWAINGAAAGTGATLSGGFVGGDVVECTATPFDGTDVGAAATASLTVGNSLPVLTSVSVSPSAPVRADTLTCTPGPTTDADGTTTFSYSYSWTVNGTAAGTSTTLSGAFAKGDTVSCSARANDGTASGSWVSAAAVTIGDTAPVVSAVTLSPTLVYEASTVTCSPTGSDADGDGVGYTYAWSVNGAAVAATGGTLTGAYFNKGDSLACAATPTDGTLSGSPASSASVTVGNTAPTAPVAALSTSAPEAGVDDIVCSLGTASTDADAADSVSYTFTWTKNGSAYTGAATTSTTSTVAASAIADADVFVCSVSATDGAATSATSTATATALGALYTIGHYTTYSGTGSEATGYLFAEKITVSAAASLYELGKYNVVGSSGSTFSMALYTTSGGAPGTLVGYTGSATAPTVGYQEQAVVGAPVSIAAGDYWIAWWCSGSNCRTSYSTSGADGATTNTIYYRSYSGTFGTWPATWPASSSTLTGQIYALYGLVR